LNAGSHAGRKLKDVAMIYVVRATVSEGVRPIALRFDTLDKALRQARAFIERGVDSVSLADGDGHLIDGLELAACCRGEKSLSPDLKAS
jgi:hypothetical protein